MKKKLLIVSDSHGNYSRLESIISREAPFDAIVHCGDGAPDLFHAGLPPGTVQHVVTGNVDLHRNLDYERVLVEKINGTRLFISHGDMFRVQNGLGRLEAEALKFGADLILFGHTHVQFKRETGPLIFNPGTAAHGQYGVIQIGETIEMRHNVME